MRVAPSTRRRREHRPSARPFRPADYANGDRQCPGWSDRIDATVCAVRSVLFPERCSRCAAESYAGGTP